MTQVPYLLKTGTQLARWSHGFCAWMWVWPASGGSFGRSGSATIIVGKLRFQVIFTTEQSSASVSDRCSCAWGPGWWSVGPRTVKKIGTWCPLWKVLLLTILYLVLYFCNAWMDNDHSHDLPQSTKHGCCGFKFITMLLVVQHCAWKHWRVS